MSRIIFSAVDLGTLQAVRDITPIISADDSATITQDSESETVWTGELQFAGARTWLEQLLRIHVVHDDGEDEIIGTFFPTLTSVERLDREIAVGKIRLDGTLSALDSTLLQTTYVIGRGQRASDVIRDMCSLAGVQSDIDSSLGDARYATALFYDVGASTLEVALDAAEKAGVSLTSDRTGQIVIRSDATIDTTSRFVAGGPRGDITSELQKSFSFVSAPTRVIASFTDSDRSIFTTVQSDDTPLRHRDMSLSVRDLPVEDIETLRAVAEQALSEERQETWSFSCLHRSDIDAGDWTEVEDTDTGEHLTGRIVSIQTHLDGLYEQEVTVRGTIS